MAGEAPNAAAARDVRAGDVAANGATSAWATPPAPAAPPAPGGLWRGSGMLVALLGRSDTLQRHDADALKDRAAHAPSPPPPPIPQPAPPPVPRVGCDGAGDAPAVPSQLAAWLASSELPPPARDAVASLEPAAAAAVLACGCGASPTLPALLSLLQRIPFYDFDAFAFSSAARGRPLSALFLFLTVRLGLAEPFRIPLHTLAAFARACEDAMPSAPPNGYHNVEHVADVLHSVALLLTGGLQDLARLADEPLTQLGLLLAAAVHDLAHPGLTGDHLVAIGHPWAIAHNDESVLEQTHLQIAFTLLQARGAAHVTRRLGLGLPHTLLCLISSQRPTLDWTAAMPKAQRVALRKLVIELVKATDSAWRDGSFFSRFFL